ncbi:diaminopimelate decarboxylase [Ruminiclostridium papyrosolvens DSM 2782]|uniref:Diaminopimelate decarboxylase n=1 Tax=Ruminiclostridium papyrosolvens DSM 2782 TaxID=588581 RepID=F1TC40_9FIRM|nr:diaminopimelate decarboxylase [Ruminiclostridium papyrosolvens]EGD47955.1 diaminopimelate decarboxylase [Ruminiclostridium papyrosolvens DSM 2782]WES35154.1 diaminopimelate decarboxylase [Ruminiclostridium papyrosolvens DSM 2782]
MTEYYSTKTNFFGNSNPEKLIKEYGSPLYVYNEKILRQKCRDMKNLVDYKNFIPNYSIKANSNLTVLKIVKEEGLRADAMSAGEIQLLLHAGFKPENLFFVPNNVSEAELKYAVENGVLVSVDSLSQLEILGKINQGGKAAVRFNPGVGAGHHEKVVTAGKKTKFGVNIDCVNEVKAIAKKYNMKICGVNQHIGSLFMEGDSYIEGVKSLLAVAEQFEDIDFVDMGGGFGIPYKKQEGQEPLDLASFKEKLTQVLEQWTDKYGKKILFKTEPGRYIVAESGVLLGNVYATKANYGNKYVGTDIGFNVLARPVMYDSHHDIEVYRNGNPLNDSEVEEVTVVGNICESGDIIAKNRELPVINQGDILGIMDAGAYGFAMSSNYNMRLRPAEVLIKEDGEPVLIRRRDTFEDLIANFNI